LRTAVAIQLTEAFGRGHWSAHVDQAGVRRTMDGNRVLVARTGSDIVATVTLGTRKPWAIDRAYFTPVDHALYLTDMAVAPGRQRTGLGRRVMAAATAIATAWPADAIRLDAYDAPAGAGPFYARCGFAECGRAVYRRVPLVYYELLLA
jgi:GNAT superfamily N-acetyltransferase